MEAMLYASASGALVLVPACFEPSRELIATHGRLHACGRIDLADLRHTALWARIHDDFDRNSFALLSQQDAGRLFGGEAIWGFSDRRRAPREVPMSFVQVRKRVLHWLPAAKRRSKALVES